MIYVDVNSCMQDGNLCFEDLKAEVANVYFLQLCGERRVKGIIRWLFITVASFEATCVVVVVLLFLLIDFDFLICEVCFLLLGSLHVVGRS